MTSVKKWMKGAASVLMAASAFVLVVGVLLIPNVVVGDEFIRNLPPDCSTCKGGCAGSNPPCSTSAQKCTTAPTGCDATCTCGLPTDATKCACE